PSKFPKPVVGWGKKEKQDIERQLKQDSIDKAKKLAKTLNDLGNIAKKPSDQDQLKSLEETLFVNYLEGVKQKLNKSKSKTDAQVGASEKSQTKAYKLLGERTGNTKEVEKLAKLIDSGFTTQNLKDASKVVNGKNLKDASKVVNGKNLKDALFNCVEDLLNGKLTLKVLSKFDEQKDFILDNLKNKIATNHNVVHNYYAVKSLIKQVESAKKVINKICHALLHDEDENLNYLKNLIAQKKFTLVGGDDRSYDKYDRYDPHAEMNLAIYLYNKNRAGDFYFGISKLKCYDCDKDLMTLNQFSNLTISSRGSHNVKYSHVRHEYDMAKLLKQDNWVVEEFNKYISNLPASEQGSCREDFSDSSSMVKLDVLGNG
ncbi:MAG: hypothetical protein DGJ47_000707, partial [Rickettsiaceae bacterium]